MRVTLCRSVALLSAFALVALALFATATTATAQSTDSAPAATVALASANVTSGEFALFDALGAQGWELVSCQTARLPGVLSDSDVTACYFKRPVTAQPAASSAP